MLRRRPEVEAVALVQPVARFAEQQRWRALQHIAELLALVRIVRLRRRTGRERYENGLERVALRVRHQPADAAAIRRFLDEHILHAVDDLFILRLVEKGGDVGAQRLENIQQCCNGGGGDVALELGDEPL